MDDVIAFSNFFGFAPNPAIGDYYQFWIGCQAAGLILRRNQFGFSDYFPACPLTNQR